VGRARLAAFTLSILRIAARLTLTRDRSLMKISTALRELMWIGEHGRATNAPEEIRSVRRLARPLNENAVAPAMSAYRASNAPYPRQASPPIPIVPSFDFRFRFRPLHPLKLASDPTLGVVRYACPGEIAAGVAPELPNKTERACSGCKSLIYWLQGQNLNP
jgi:hypothetical protein